MVLRPLQSASCRELLIARTAQHAARQLHPVLPPRLGVLVNLIELAINTVGWVPASLVAASPSRFSKRLVPVHSPLQSASLHELMIARPAQHAARQLPPVLSPRLGLLVNLDELLSLCRVPASLVAAPRYVGASNRFWGHPKAWPFSFLSQNKCKRRMSRAGDEDEIISVTMR